MVSLRVRVKLKIVDLDLHKYPASIRFKFLELLGIKQKTTGVPKAESRLNLVEHFKDGNRSELEKRTKWLNEQPASEGNVVSAASRPYQLTSGRRPYQMLKYHLSTTFTAIVLEAIETKTKGVYNLKWGISTGKRKVKDQIIRKLGSVEYAYGGKTFATTKGSRGDKILIECETFNVIHDMGDRVFDFSAWAPRMMGITDKSVQTIDQVEAQAIKDRVFQAKIIDEDGKTHYLPGKSGEELPSKEVEVEE